MTPEPVTFEPVDEEADRPDPAPEGPEPEASRAGPERESRQPVREAEREPYPLAGPILDEARARVLRGRCSSCEARLRLRLEEERKHPIKIRCPICGQTGVVEA